MSRDRVEQAELDRLMKEMVIKENNDKWQGKIDKANSDLENKISNFEEIRNKKDQLSGLQKYENFVKWKNEMQNRKDR